KSHVAAGSRFLEADGRSVARGRFHETGKQRRFRDSDGGCWLTQISHRCRLDAVETVAGGHLIEIHLENRIFRELPFETRGDDDLRELPPVGFFRREQALPGKLLRDRAATLRASTFGPIAQRGARDADYVDPVVIVEALILDGENRVDEVRRHARQRHVDPFVLEDRESGWTRSREAGLRV